MRSQIRAVVLAFIVFGLLLVPSQIALAHDGHEHDEEKGPFSNPEDFEPQEWIPLEEPDNGRNAPSEISREAAAVDPQLYGEWSEVYDWPVVAIHANLMPDGNVLAWDGYFDDLPNRNGWGWGQAVQDFTNVTLWNPISNTHEQVLQQNDSNMFCAGHAHTPDGNIFTAGGNVGSGSGILASQQYDFGTKEWTRQPDLSYTRWYPAVTPLATGEMLVTSGGSSIPEIFDPETSTWRQLPNANQGLPLFPWLQPAPNGNVFLAGPNQTMRELDTSGTGQWTTIGQRDSINRSYGALAAVGDGKILAVGGGGSSSSSVMIDMATGGVTDSGNMTFGRRQHNVTILADGSVLATGGNYNGAGLISVAGGIYAAELWNPDTGQWSTLASMDRTRQYHSTALLLPDGRVLSAGGGFCGACTTENYHEANAEVFSPPYLFAPDGSPAVRPEITSAPPATAYANTINISSPDAAAIDKVGLVKLSSVTHSTNFEQRYVPLNFTQNGSALNVDIPSSPNAAPPGYYMLFIINDQGVPSVARMIQLVSSNNPEAVITITDAAANNTTFWFDGTQSVEANSPIIQYDWEFGDGTTATGATVQHSYSIGGDYTVKLTVTDGANRTDVSSSIKTVEEPINLAVGATASQSSTWSNSTADLAIDGDINGDGDDVIAHTAYQSEAWWEVDLGQVYDITTITLWNRTDCCSWRLRDFYIFASDEPFTDTSVAGTLAQSGVGNFYHDDQAGIQTHMPINRSARYLRVQMTGQDYLQLAEVIVRGDLSSQPNGSAAKVGEWRLDDEVLLTGAGNVPDATGNHPGTAYNSPVTSNVNPAIAGSNGSCRYMDVAGTNQGIVVPFSEELNPRDFTIALWTRVDGRSGNWRSPVSTRWNSPNFQVRKGYNIYAGSDNKWHLWTGNGANGWDILIGPDVVNGEWVHIAATFEASSTLGDNRFEGIKRLYINGVASEQIGIYEPNTEKDLSIGMLNPTGGSRFDGGIDEVRIYNHALPAAAILTMMTETHPCNDNQAPIASFSDSPTTTSFGVLFDAAGSNDPDGSIVSYDWAFGNGEISGGETVNYVYSEAGNYNVTLTVTDDDGDTDTIVRQITAAAANTPPVLTDLADRSDLSGDTITLQVVATDDDNHTLTYNATGLPSGLSINSATGLIDGTASNNGTFNVNVTVNDGHNGVDTLAFIWTVIEADQVAINPIASLPRAVNTNVAFSADVTGGNSLRYRWQWGDGTQTGFNANNVNRNHSYSAPGRYLVTLTVRDFDNSDTSYQFIQNIYAAHTAIAPQRSSSIIFHNGQSWNANPDNRSVSVIDDATQTKIDEITVGLNPVSLAVAPDGRIWVINKESANISIVDTSTRTVAEAISLPYGSRPHGLLFVGGNAYVTLEARGELIKINPANKATTGTLDVGPNVRHISADSTNTLYIARFITPLVPGETTGNPNPNAGGAEIVVVNNMAIAETIQLAHSNEPDTEFSGRGIPNYLGGMTISPDGLSGWVPSKQDNIARGTLRDGNPLTHDSTVRAITSRLDLTSGNGSEVLADRIDYNNTGVVSAAAYGKYGNYIFFSLETNKEVAIVDAYGKTLIGRINVGSAPQGLTVSDDGLSLYVHNFTDRTVSIADLTDLIMGTSSGVYNPATVGVVANEVLAADVLLGKQFFYDASSEALALESYVSCASCHNEGDSDGRVWDFTGFDEGLRNTISLVGRGGAEHGALHWTANFDEFHDFEGQIRSFAGGTGLMSNADFANTSGALGAPKAGLSSDLDALAAYMQSLGSFGDSPYRESNGSLTAAAQAGAAIFETQSCASCHSGQGYTDSPSGQRHDVGTITAASGERIGGTLDGFDTPTLRGLYATAPYLHDGSAATVAEAVAAHDGVNLSAGDLADLEAYLLQIDDNEAAPSNGGGGSCETQGLLHEWWNDIPGGSIASLTGHEDYPNQPSGSATINTFEVPANIGENYGVRVRGYIIAPETGSYTFWLASDDEGALWLSSDDTPENALNIANVWGWTYSREWDKYASQQSAPIALRAGDKYYVEAIMKEYGGGDNLSVAWQTPSGTQTLLAGGALCALESLGDAPTAMATASITTGTAALTVNFDSVGSADSDGTITNYDWNFGDGSFATGAATSHTYSYAGIYTAKLTVTDDDGLLDSFKMTIHVDGGASGCAVPGSLLHENWTNIPGTSLSDLLAIEDYPYHPDSSTSISSFEIPSNTMDRYGARVRGYIVAPVTGNYKFWIATDDAGSLLLSTSADPANAAEIASVNGWTFPEEWEKYASQESAEISLQAGQTYYIEALMKEGAGGDNLAVAWQIPGGQRQIIPSPNLCGFEIGNKPPSAVLGASATEGEAPMTVNFNANGSSDSEGAIASYLWTWNDGSTSSGATASRTYNSAGVYNVTLTVTDADGLSDSESEKIIVTNAGGSGSCALPGVVNRQVWTGIWSGTVAELLTDARYPNTPTRTEIQTNFVAPSNIDDIYAVRMRAYLVAPESGSYTFYLSSDNEGQLFLSSTSNPANKVMIAQNDWSPEQDWNNAAQSVSVTLVAGETYYIEGLHSASWSTDYYAVAWSTPSNSTPEIVPSSVFCAYDTNTGGRAANDVRSSGTYTYSDLTDSPIFQTLPAEHALEIAGIFQANQALRDSAYAMRETFIVNLNASEPISGELVYEVVTLYDTLYASASPDLQTWMSGLWSQLPIANYSLVGTLAPDAMSTVNQAAEDATTGTPTAVTLGMVMQVWTVLPLVLLLTVAFGGVTIWVVRRRRPLS